MFRAPWLRRTEPFQRGWSEVEGFKCARTVRGMTWPALGGMKLGVITKRISETVALRMRDLKIEFVYQGKRSR